MSVLLQTLYLQIGYHGRLVKEDGGTEKQVIRKRQGKKTGPLFTNVSWRGSECELDKGMGRDEISLEGEGRIGLE